jgi:secreted Zn-dependent insulinase-like peptidase
VSPFDEDVLKRINNPACAITSKKLDFPPPNKMIPKNFDIIAEDLSLSQKP